MIIDSPIISGSLASTGSLTQIGNVVITGSLNVSGPIKGNITGSADSASFATTSSYAFNAKLLDGLDKTSFVYTSSYNVDSSSFSIRVTNTEATASSLVIASGSFSTRVTTLENASSSFAQQSGSNSTRLTNLEITASVLTTASASFAVVSSSFASTSGSDSRRITNLESTASVLTTASASFAIVSQSFSSTSQSLSTRVTIIESSYATTGSNLFSGTQGINSIANAISFTSTASLYTDGGARITKDLYVSGTSYFNNVTIYGTQSVNYITSSQLNIGTNIITVNTDTPTVRYGGIAVYDSGSTGLTGSMLWDSENNHWIYTNPSGSTYSGGMMISGPRASARGCEQGTTACALMMGQGGDHITSSAIYHYSNATCFYNNTVVGSGGTVCTTMANASCIGVGTMTPATTLDVSYTSAPGDIIHIAGANNVNGYIGAHALNNGGLYINSNQANQDIRLRTQGTDRLLIDSNGNAVIGSLTVDAVGSTTSLTLDRSAGNGQLSLAANGTVRGRIFADNSTSEFRIGNPTSNALMLYTANVERFRLTADGIACFACQVCVRGLTITGCVATTIIDAYNQNTDDGNGFYIKAGGVNSGKYIMALENAAGTSRMHVLANGNIGIGTTSPTRTLSISCSTGPNLELVRTGFSGYTYIEDDGTNSIYRSGGATIVQTGGTTERLRVTSTGIACFACTVCAANIISSGFICSSGDGKNLDIGGVAVIRGNGGACTTHYFTTGAANVAKYLQYNATGTAINVIAADNHSYFNSGCYVGVGVVIPRSLVEIQKTSGNTCIGAASNATLTLSQGGAINEVSQIGFGYTQTTSPAVIGFITTDAAAYTNGALVFATRNVTTDTTPTERMRITSGGNVLIGTSTDRSFKLLVEGTDNNNYMGSYNTTSGASLRLQSNSSINYLVSATNQLQVQVGSGIVLTIATTGAACFACELTAKSLGTNDLILNNLNHEHANYVDGTRGSWLIQEGACDLFIINQVSCKKYKFNLIEIE